MSKMREDEQRRWRNAIRTRSRKAKEAEEAVEMSLSKEDILHVLWHRGKISEVLLDDNQKKIYSAFKSAPGRKFVLNCGRRTGKSFLCFVLAVEECLQKPEAIVRYVAPSKQMIEQFIIPISREVLRNCPEEFKPTYSQQTRSFTFPNKSVIYLTGTEKGSADSARGTSMDLGVVDEARDIADLAYVVGDVLMPQTLTTGGRILITSTPPDSTSHEFIRQVRAAKEAGSYWHATVYDNPRVTAAEIEDMVREMGGRNSVRFRREYLAELIMDTSYAVIPEFTKERKEQIVKEMPRPPYYDAYVSCDLGFVDYSAVLFAYYDFRLAQLVVEDELVVQRTVLEELERRVAAKELELWGKDHPVYYRVMDAPPVVIESVNSVEGRSWAPAPKLPKEVGVNAIRDAVIWDRMRIHPRCEILIDHLETAVWNKKRNKFARSGEKGHFDTLDALIYLERILNKSKNPYPEAAKPTSDMIFDPRKHGENTEKQERFAAFRRIFYNGRRT